MIKKLIVLVGALLVFGAAFVLRESGSSAESSADRSTDVPAAEEALPRLVDLGADKCIPCKQMAPILLELRNEYHGSLIVEFIDVWKDPEAGKPFGVRVIPTQVFIDASGKEQFRHEGFLAKAAILAKWEELGVVLTPTTTQTGS